MKKKLKCCRLPKIGTCHLCIFSYHGTLINFKFDNGFITDCTHASTVRIPIPFIGWWKSPWSLHKNARSPKQWEYEKACKRLFKIFPSIHPRCWFPGLWKCKSWPSKVSWLQTALWRRRCRVSGWVNSILFPFLFLCLSSSSASL